MLFVLLNDVPHDYTSNIVGASLETGTAYASQAPWFIPHFWCGVCVVHLFSFVFYIFILCLVYSMLPVFLDCPFLITTLVFYNVYLKDKRKTYILPWLNFIFLTFQNIPATIPKTIRPASIPSNTTHQATSFLICSAGTTSVFA